MRFMFIVKAMSANLRLADMATYHEGLRKAGVLLDAARLEAAAPIAAYTLIEVKSREEAMEWARRYPTEIEAREVFTYIW